MYMSILSKRKNSQLYYLRLELEKLQKLSLERGGRLSFALEELPPLHAAVDMECEEVVEAILEFDLCDVDSKDHLGRTALHIACVNGNDKIVKTLLKYGSDINIMCDGKTPFESVKMAWVPKWSKISLDLIDDYLQQQVYKLVVANLYVSPQNYLYYHVPCACKTDFLEKCHVESEKDQMEIEMIGDGNISFLDILKKNENWLEKFMRNKNNVQDSDHYETKFPSYASLIDNKFRKGKSRIEFLDSGTKMFCYLFEHLPELPVECAEEILSYLSNEELRVFNGCACE